jgi:hypothetical protein
MSDLLPVVDGLRLPDKVRSLLRPGEMMEDERGHPHQLPRFFFQVDSWEQAKKTKLTAHFTLAELVSVDSHEHRELLDAFPHFVPCGVAVLARYLEEFRTRVDSPVLVSVNGGYRSPAHALSKHASPHLWATGVDIFRIGDTWMDSQKNVERFARIAEGIGQELFVKPYGPEPEGADDHLHLDLGFLHVVPRGVSEKQPD